MKELRKGDGYVVERRDRPGGTKEDLNFSRRFFDSRRAARIYFPISEATAEFGGSTHKDGEEVYTKIEVKQGEDLADVIDKILTAYDQAEYDYLCEEIPQMMSIANELAERLELDEDAYFYADSIHVKPEEPEGEETPGDE